MSTETLRGLAKGYAKGTIAKDNYRKSRAELIKAIIEGKVAVKTIDYEPPLKPNNELDEAITEGIVRNKTEITSPQKKTKPTVQSATPKAIQENSNKKKKSPFAFILVSSIIVLSLILTVILFYPKPPASNSVESTSTENSNVSINSTSSVTTNISSVGETLIADFLREKNWNENSLKMFTDSWSALSEEERTAASNTKRMQRMKDSIYKQFLEGKALASIDSQKAIIKQQKLIDFASTIGINDSRLILE